MREGDVEMSEILGRDNESVAIEFYTKKGFTVLNQNDAGFPDLLLLKDKQLVKMVEVKGGGHKAHRHQREYLQNLRNRDFEIEIVRVNDGTLVIEEVLEKKYSK